MAETPGTGSARALLAYLRDRAPRVAFYQALQMLERLMPDRVRIGYEGPPSREGLRIRPSLSLSSPPSDLESIELPERAADPVRLTATFLGLYGADSPLPPIFAEHLAQLQGELAGERIRDFLDIFHHRLYSLLYRAWRKSRPVSTRDHLDPLYDRLLALIGYSGSLAIGGPGLPHLAEARLQVLHARTAAGLAGFIALRLRHPVRVQQLQPRMVAVPGHQRSCLGRDRCELGNSMLLGARVADRGKVVLSVRADDHAMWLRFAPGGDGRQRLDRAVGDYLHEPLEYDVELRMGSEHVPPAQLGRRTTALGRDMWLGRPRPEARWRWSGARPLGGGHEA